MRQYEPPAYQPPQGYGRTPAYQPPTQAPYPYYPPPQPQHFAPFHPPPPKSSGTAVFLEILPGFFFQTFGIGHIYAGRVGAGLLLMFGYWFVQFVNLLLCFILVGFVTLPLCFLLAMILSPVSAANAASRAPSHR